MWGVRIKTPATARNTDGIDPDSSTNVTVNDSYIQDGDDGIAIKTNASAASGITIENSHFYGTHGISIGSETQYGVSNVLVENDTVQGTDSSGNESSEQQRDPDQDQLERGRQGQRRHLRRHLRDRRQAGPDDFNPFYASGNGSTTPDFTSIVVDGFKSVDSASGAESVLEGFDSSNPLGLTLENVDLDSTTTSAEYADIGEFDTNITPSGTDVTVTSISGSGSVPSCSFPSYPGL